MPKLVVKKKGQLVNEVPLDTTKEFLAGRKPESDIPLDAEKGISREHFKIYCLDGVWKLECISKLGNIVSMGVPVMNLDLKGGEIFSVPPYDFEFLEDGAVRSSTSSQMTSTIQLQENQVGHSQVTSSDRTVVHKVSLAAYIKIVNEDGDVQQKIKLEGGDTWVAGRDNTAAIMIADHRVSRKQFEIRKTTIGYEIVDMGSVNGTYINEKLLESTDSVYLKSGDVIRILNHNLVFEVHDPNFFEKIEKLAPLPQEEELPPQIIYQDAPQLQQPMGMPVLESPPEYAAQPMADERAERTKKIRILIAIIAVVAGVFYMMAGDDKSVDSPSAAVPIGSDPLAGLTAQQKSEYKQSLELAKRYYMEGNYSLALSEVEELAKTYKVNDPDLEKLKNTAFAAIETQKQLIKQEKEEKDRQIMEAKIKLTVQDCQKKLIRFNKEEELDACLVEALQLNPAHQLVIDLKSQMQAQISEREAKRAQAAAYNKRVQQLKTIYENAKQSEKKEPYLTVLDNYKKVIASTLPDPNNLKIASEKRLKQLKSEMAKKIKEFEKQAEEQRQKQNLRDAVLTLREAVKIDPTRQDLIDKSEDIKNELRKLMMVYYQEGVLEEGFGNVESGESKQGAKDKWKKILELDLPDGEYYKKAYIKMKKYGAQ